MPNDWLDYSLKTSGPDRVFKKGEKLGKVTFDLRSVNYDSIPPSFSGDCDVGTKIYKIKGFKPEYAVLLDTGYYHEPLYRSYKCVQNPADLDPEISDVFAMLSADPTVTEVELRNRYDKAWMNTSSDLDLVSLINDELPGLPLLSIIELGDINPYDSDFIVPVNLIFADGAALTVHFYPELRLARAFGGYIQVSEELNSLITALHEQGSPYPRLIDLTPYNERQIRYLCIQNGRYSKEFISDDVPSELIQILTYYRVEETEDPGTRPFVTATLGKSVLDNTTIRFIKIKDNKVVTEINGRYYKPVRGQLAYRSFESFCKN